MNWEEVLGHGAPYFWYPVTLGLVGSLLLLTVAGITVWSLFGAFILVAAALASGLRLLSLIISKNDTPVIAQNTSRLREMCLRTFPLWSGQIDTSRRNGDKAALKLTQIFSMAVDDIQSALAASRSAVAEISGKDGGVLAAINSSEAALLGVVEILKTVQHGKKELHTDVKKFASDLREMVGDVQHIALQVRILSFNAAIEAAQVHPDGTKHQRPAPPRGTRGMTGGQISMEVVYPELQVPEVPPMVVR